MRGSGRGRTPRRNRKRAINDGTPEDTAEPAQTAEASSQGGRPALSEPVPLDTPRFADLAGTDVHPALLAALTQDMKFDHMMPVQVATIHELLPPRRSDCLVQARTGTGKTVAFLLPAIQTMVGKKPTGGGAEGVSLLVISPTRELALQIAAEAEELLRRLPRYRVCVAIGGTNKDKEEKQLLGGCDVLIATPGRLLDHMGSNATIKQSLGRLDTLVLDEADRLLDMGFMQSLKDIVAALPDKIDGGWQGMLFSATIPSYVEKVALLVLRPGYKFISTIPAGELNTHERVVQHVVTVPTFSSVATAMVGCIREEVARAAEDGVPFKAILFATTAALADFYSLLLTQLPSMPAVSTLHARMSQNKRTKVTNDFRDASSGVILVATDVVARGMDFPGVTVVLQAGAPSDRESYVHRLGRTARAGAAGRGVLVVSQDEAFFPTRVLRDIGPVPREPNLSLAQDIQDIAEKMEDDQRGRIYQSWLGYYKAHLKALQWDNERLVREGNIFARDALAAPETPPLQKSTVSKMGLRGTKGLVVVPDAPRPHHNRNKPESAPNPPGPHAGEQFAAAPAPAAASGARAGAAGDAGQSAKQGNAGGRRGKGARRGGKA